MSPIDIISKEEVIQALRNLKTFSDFLKKRKTLIKVGEVLNDFFIFNGELLISGSKIFIKENDNSFELKSPMLVALTNELTSEERKLFLKGYIKLREINPPKKNTKCFWCERRWTVHNMEDFCTYKFLQHGDKYKTIKYFHRGCAILFWSNYYREQIVTCFSEYGIDRFVLKDIIREVGSKAFLFEFIGYGVQFTIGFREDKIEVDMDDLEKIGLFLEDSGIKTGEELIEMIAYRLEGRS